MPAEQFTAIDALREIVSRLHISAGALCALGAALDAHANGTPLEPAIAAHVQQILSVLGAGDALARVEPLDALPLSAEIRLFTLTNSKLLSAATHDRGWTHAETELLQAAGNVSVTVAHSIRHRIVPGLDGLAARLEQPGAAFLDIGVGVAALSIEMARLWPNLRVVGVDHWKPALDVARANVRAAGISERVELRLQDGRELPDSNAFDLVWIPGAFIPDAVAPALLQRAHKALRPGGWALFAMFCPRQDPLGDAVLRLRAAMFGGAVRVSTEGENLMREQGFAQVHTLPRRPDSAAAMVAGRRAPPSFKGE
jgi:SAM-dependent methyltransferase